MSENHEPAEALQRVTTPEGRGRLENAASWLVEHGDALFRYALMRVRSHDLAEELVQQTILAALQSRDRFEGRSAHRTWLIAILRRKIVDYFREKRRREGRLTEPADDLSDEQLFDARRHWKSPVAAWSADPAVLAENVEFWSAFRRCFGRLPQPLADVFALRELESMESEEICKILRITPSNLWVRLHRARLLLQQCLEKCWFAGGRKERVE